MNKRLATLSLCLLLIAGCGGGKNTSDIADLQKSNEDLTRRVKALEDDLLQANKKIIQHEQALQAMHERLRDMETYIAKIQMGQTR